MEAFHFGQFPVIIIWWWYALAPIEAQYADMVCDNLGMRSGRKISQPGPECDMSERNWCTIKTCNYPEDIILEIILDNRGVMKRLFGDQREARFLEDEFHNHYNEDVPPLPPLSRRKKKNKNSSKESSNEYTNGKYSGSDILSNSRHGKRIDIGDPMNMEILSRHSSKLTKIDKEDVKKTENILQSGKKRPKVNVDKVKTESVTKQSLDESPSRTNDKVFDTTFNVKNVQQTKTTTGSTTTTTTTTSTTTSSIITSTTTPKTEDTIITTSEPSPTTVNAETPVSNEIVEDRTISPSDSHEIRDFKILQEANENLSIAGVTIQPEDTDKVNDESKSVTTNSISEMNQEPKIKLDIENEAETSNASKEVENSSNLSDIPIDIGDALTYTPSGSQVGESYASQLESPSDESLPLSEAATQGTTTIHPGSKIKLKKPSTDFLEGRVEFPTRYPYIPLRKRPTGHIRRPPYKGHQQAFNNRPGAHNQPPPQRERTELGSSSINENPSSAPSKKQNTRPPTKPPAPTWMEKFPACNSTSELIAPTWAKNIQGKNLIVVNVGSFMQHLHVEECAKEALYRKMFCQRGCRCEQQYRLQKLLVVDPDDECRGIFSDWFRFPSSCVCVCYPASLSMATSGRDGRIIDAEEVDYFDEDSYEDDMNDPLVRHYYGLDEEENTNNQNNWQEITKNDYNWEENNVIRSSASAHQPTYVSFTDIESIDRSLTKDHPVKYVHDTDSNELQSGLIGNSNDGVDVYNVREHSNKTKMMSSRENKSRLLKGFESTRRSRAQMMPVRFASNAIPPYAMSWLNSHSLPFWPSISLIHQLKSRNNSPNYLTSRSLNGAYQGINLPLKVRVATPSSVNSVHPTLGTVNTATRPFYRWNRKLKFLGNSANNDTAENNTFVLSRIPRDLDSVHRHKHNIT